MLVLPEGCDGEDRVGVMLDEWDVPCFERGTAGAGVAMNDLVCCARALFTHGFHGVLISGWYAGV